MSEGFFGRWAKRKEAVREGKAVPAEPAAEPLPAQAQANGQASPDAGPVAPAPEPPPTLQDVQSLTPESDFTRFTRADVAPEVKNAAMKKLFSDPHFNVMDGLDTYIDDYGKPDPLPPAMLRQLASARFLKLFDEEEDEEKGKPPQANEGREVADDPVAQTVAQSQSAEPAVPPPTPHADPDLRLQQDHAPGPPGPGQGTG
jgi:hypothetical protein